jgi:hypothetical protein
MQERMLDEKDTVPQWGISYRIDHNSWFYIANSRKRKETSYDTANHAAISQWQYIIENLRERLRPYQCTHPFFGGVP